MLLVFLAAAQLVDAIRLAGRDVPSDVQTVLPPVLDLAPIFWLHTPKVGSSFATTLAHHVCGKAIQETEWIREPAMKAMFFRDRPGRGNCPKVRTAAGCSTNRWNANCGQGSFLRFDSGHDPLPRDFPEEDLRHVAMLFREPRQRAISGWTMGRHSCKNASDVQAYAECVQSCMAQMLTGTQCGGPLPSASGIETATSRVWKLGFVGLTSEWELSVCLFHAMHGGTCKAVEFFNTRPGVRRAASVYNVSAYNLSDYAPGDDSVYEAAQQVFWENVRKYGVTRRSCMELSCSNVSEFFQIEGGGSEVTLARQVGEEDLHAYDWPGRRAFDED